MNLFVITLSLFLATNKGSLVAAKDNIRKNKSAFSGQLDDHAVQQNLIPSDRLLTSEEEADGSLRFIFKHDGHCASGWMGNNIWVNSLEDCAATCRDREECAFFAYEDSVLYSNNCATYYFADGCPNDGRYPNFRAYELQRGSDQSQIMSVHPGHCASGWMGDNRNVDSIDDCATLCREREGCRYISYDESNSYATNCATYWLSGGCPEDGLFLEFDSYQIGWYLYYDFFQNGVCASDWMGDNKKVDSIDDCAAICFDRNECEYFAYDASNSYNTNCATYYAYDGCPQASHHWEYVTYRIDRLAE